MGTRNRRSVLLVLVIALAGVSCRKGTPPTVKATPPTTLPASDRFPKVIDANLPNAHRVTDKVIAGGVPNGDAGFKDLHTLGVKTIISVDGMTPDVEGVRKYGIRYVHLPIGYDSVPEDQGEAIAKAINELLGPVYIHCHHGKHRSPAAATVACVYNGTLPADEAMASLTTFGTGANYKGLWQSARDAKPKDPKAIRELKVSFVEKAEIPEMAHAMVEIDDHTDYLKLTQKAGWKQPKDHPDLDPPHEALMLQELLVEAGRSESAKSEPAEFQKMMTDSAKAADGLREVLLTKPIDAAAADAAFKQIAVSCTTCHAKYRDEPPTK